MKRHLCFLLCVSVLLCLLGCAKDEPDVPVEFFYLQNGFSYDTHQSVIGSEVRETAGVHGYTRILDLYLKGPKSNTLSPTFPEDSRIISLSQGPSSVSLVLSDAFASLAGIELSIACICLAKTVIHLTGCTAVTIQAESLLLDGEKSITLDNSGVLLYDNYYGQTKSK